MLVLKSLNNCIMVESADTHMVRVLVNNHCTVMMLVVVNSDNWPVDIHTLVVMVSKSNQLAVVVLLLFLMD